MATEAEGQTLALDLEDEVSQQEQGHKGVCKNPFQVQRLMSRLTGRKHPERRPGRLGHGHLSSGRVLPPGIGIAPHGRPTSIHNPAAGRGGPFPNVLSSIAGSQVPGRPEARSSALTAPVGT